MACKRTKLKRHNNPWLDDIDELELKFKQTRKDDSKVKSRKTWNSRCGTDFGVFEQVTNDRDKAVENSGAIAMTEDISVTITISNRDSIENLKNTMPSNNLANSGNVNQILSCTSNAVDKETSLGDEDQILNERGSADNSSNVGQGSQIAEAQEMEIQIIKEKLVNLPATVDVKQENSLDEEEEIQIIQEKLVKVPATVHFKQENSSDEEEELQIIQENLVETPSISNIKQEKSFYQPKVTFTLVNGNLETVSQATHQRDLRNGQIRIRKDIQITSVRKQPVGTTESPVKSDHRLGLSEFLTSSKQPAGISKHPVHCEHLEVPPYVNTVSVGISASSSLSTGSSASSSFSTGLSASSSSLPTGSSASSSFSTGSSASNSSSSSSAINSLSSDSSGSNSSSTGSSASSSSSTGSQTTSPIIVSGDITGANGTSKSCTISNYHSGPLESLATSKQTPGTPEISLNSPEEPPHVNTAAQLPKNTPSGLTITPVVSSASNPFFTDSSRDTTEATRHIQERANKYQENSPENNKCEEATGSFHVETTQGNSPVSNESKEVTGPIHDENSPVSNGSEEVSGPIHDITTRGNKPVNNENEEVSGPLHDGTTQGNSPVNNENEEVTVVLHDGAIDLDFENQERDLFDIIEDRAFKGKQIPSASNVSRNSLPQEYHGPVEKEIFMEVDNGDFENGQSIHDRRLTSMLPSESDTEVASMSIPSQLECSKSSKNHVELSNDEEDVEDEVEKQIELVPKIKIKRNLIQWAFEFDSDSILTSPRKTSKRLNVSSDDDIENQMEESPKKKAKTKSKQWKPYSKEKDKKTGPIHDENSLVSNGSKEVGGPIHEKTTRGNSTANNENEEVSGPLHDGTAQGNSPVNNENEEVTVVLHDGSIGQKTGSQRNLTIKLGTGDVTVTDGGRTVQMKMSDGSISGQADDVVNLVKTLKQVVCDL